MMKVVLVATCMFVNVFGWFAVVNYQMERTSKCSVSNQESLGDFHG